VPPYGASLLIEGTLHIEGSGLPSFEHSLVLPQCAEELLAWPHMRQPLYTPCPTRDWLAFFERVAKVTDSFTWSLLPSL